MPWWVVYVVMVALIAISYALAPSMKIKSTPMQPDSQLDLPTTEEGRSIGVVFGTAWVTDPVVAWWGDLKTTAIYS